MNAECKRVQTLNEVILDICGVPPAFRFNPDKAVGDRTNAERAEKATEALLLYGQSGDPDDLRDILADLMHYADRQGLDFAEALRDARHNHKAER